MRFVAFPDNPAGTSASEGFSFSQRVEHPSGRPWILGDWAPDEVTVVDAGRRRLVLLGRLRPAGAPTPDELARARCPSDLDPLIRRMPGLFHLAVSMDGHVRLQGSLTGVRQVFTARVHGTTIAADGVAQLLETTGARVDEALLACRLLAPGGAPWPLSQRPVRSGIEVLATGHWLEIDTDGRAGQVRWWDLPSESLTLATGADALRAALDAAMSVRASAHRVMSADLSGGLDSTSLCFLAARTGTRLITYHVRPLDGANRDGVWADRAAAALPRAEHVILPADLSRNVFDVGAVADVAGSLSEGPMTWAAGITHIRDLADRDTDRGASLHLTGFGGDELFGRTPACAWSLAHAHPVTALSLVNRYRLANRWPWRATLRALLDRSDFPRDLERVSDTLRSSLPPIHEPDFGWTSALRMPPWSTPEALDAVRGLLREVARHGPGPLDPDRTRHQALASLAFEGTTLRQIATLLQGRSVTWDAPFLDDRVVEAALSTRIRHRLAAGRFKPLLVDTMRPLVPPGILSRTDKGEFSAEIYRGLERNRDRLLELCEDSALARLGLIDPQAFRRAVLSPGPTAQHLHPIESTVACESWLRSLDRSPSRPSGGHR